jgi:hypothetical protein
VAYEGFPIVAPADSQTRIASAGSIKRLRKSSEQSQEDNVGKTTSRREYDLQVGNLSSNVRMSKVLSAPESQYQGKRK